jgi:hypothetical protein
MLPTSLAGRLKLYEGRHLEKVSITNLQKRKYPQRWFILKHFPNRSAGIIFPDAICVG